MACRQGRSRLLSRRGLSFGDFLGRLLDGLRSCLGLGRCLALGCRLGLGSLRALDVLGNLFFSGHSSLNLGLHRRDKAGRHTIELAHAGKRTLDILGARFGHSCHVTLGGLATGLALGIGLTRSVGPAVTVPVVDVCHTWPPFLSLPLSAFPIHDTPPSTKKTAPKDRLSHRFTRTASTAAIRSGCAGTR